MRIAAISDIAEATGFGRVMRQLALRWIEAGADMRIVGINWRGAAVEIASLIEKRRDADEIRAAYQILLDDPVIQRTVPAAVRSGDPMGNDMTAPLVDGELTADWKPDVLLIVADPRAMLERLLTDRGACGRVRTFNYVPIEGSNLTPAWRNMWGIASPVAMSDFGARELGALLGRNDVPVIRHGISDTFYRVTPERPGLTADGTEITSRDEAKRLLGWEGRTVILRTDRHVPRKAYPAFVDAIRPIIAAHPEVLVVIHCAPLDEGGVLPELLAGLPGAYNPSGSLLGWKHSQVLLTSAHDTFRGFTDRQLNLLYNAADLYVSPTQAEGFGLTLAEAAACGVPVITTDFAAGPEAIGPGGVLVPPAAIVGTSHSHRWAIPDVPAFSAAIEALIGDPAERARLGALGEAHARQFDWDSAALQFLRLFES